ncbi:glucans biosynthesis glucosyltransferase MdoH [Leptospira sp. 96542]|nr:glucans biosynthesis glucosyltransferase MdoH [Leptospira sp. 96542]
MILFRRFLFLCCLTLPMIWALMLFFQISSFRGFEITEYYQFLTLLFLLPTLSYGATTALFGFVQNRKKNGDKTLISNTTNQYSHYPIENVSTAVVMPIYEEDTNSTFSRIQIMYENLVENGKNQNIDFYILSDTRTPEHWIKEEFAYTQLCETLKNYKNIHYRRRKNNLNGKSGNIADFCRRWGKQYEYMIILDADSFMTRNLAEDLIKLMELHPNIGILQTANQLFRSKTVYQSLTQFNAALFGSIFHSGAHYWQQNSSGYWGHNAIVRIKPFMEHCALPQLPDYGALGGKILSHDTVEAALMRKAGYDVVCAYNLTGSFEENPPNLIDSLKRDQRWCQGNLQHFWFLFGKKIPFTNRIQIFLGILAYLNAPIWASYIGLSIWNYAQDSKFLNYSMLPEEFDYFKKEIYDPLYFKLLILSISLLFLPRLLGYLDAILSKRKNKFGGFWNVSFGFTLETLVSIITAPIHLVYFSVFVLSTVFNKKIFWEPQNRDANSQYSFSYTTSSFFGITLLGIASAYISFEYSEILFYSTMPIWIGWILSIPLVYFTGFPKFRKFHLFQTNVDTNPASEIKALNSLLDKQNDSKITGKEFFYALIHPYYYKLHKQMQGDKKSSPKQNLNYESEIKNLIHNGPNNVHSKVLSKILTDKSLIEAAHLEFWQSNPTTWAPYFQNIWKEFNPSYFP